MRSLSAGWLRCLAARTPKVLLCTVDPSGGDPLGTEHPALRPGAIAAATDRDPRQQHGIEVSHAGSGRRIPFAPYLAAWPAIAKLLSPQEFRAEIAATTLEFVGHPRFIEALGSTTNASVRIDLWADGLDLSEALPIFAGRTYGDAAVDIASGTARIPCVDGNPYATAAFPPSVVDHDEFPDAPDEIAGQSTAPVIFGAYPERSGCVPISRDRRRWIVQAGVPTKLPSAVQRGGVDVATGWRFVIGATAKSAAPYLELQFADPPDQLVGGANGQVTVSGGVGIVAQNPIEYLSGFAGVALDPGTKSMLARPDFDFDSVHSFQSPALDLITQRLAPQIACAAAQDLGRMRLFPVGFDADGPAIRVGSELICALQSEWVRSADGDIANSISIACGRDVFGNSSPLATVIRSPEWSSPVRSLQAASRSRFGHRFLEFPANDLVVERDAGGIVVGCRAGERTGDIIGDLLAFPLLSMRYAARWDFGMIAERGDTFRLTDEANGVSNAPAKVIEWALTETGPEVTLAIRQPA